jgi:hypothetical protein
MRRRRKSLASEWNAMNTGKKKAKGRWPFRRKA